MLQEAAPQPSAPELPSIEEIAPRPAPPAPAAHKPAPVANDSPTEFEIPLEPVIDSPSGATSSFEDLSAELAAAPPPFAEAEDEPVAMSFEEEPVKTAPPPRTPAKPAVAPPPPPKEPEPELELEQDYELVIAPEPLVPAFDQKPPESHAPAAMSADQFLSDMASELDDMGIDKLAPIQSKSSAPIAAAPAPPAPPLKPPQAPPAPPVQQQVESGPLQEVFDEFRAELGEMGGEEEDLETHYNLGIAFREMGLLEEAISEFQKVAKATDRGKAFRYAMQCCTLLGLAFMEKGQPNIAAIWYERALHTPGVDAESTLALRYDLGVAQESAGDIEGALKSFSQVYAANIDYRDVADRIASLQKPTR